MGYLIKQFMTFIALFLSTLLSRVILNDPFGQGPFWLLHVDCDFVIEFSYFTKYFKSLDSIRYTQWHR